MIPPLGFLHLKQTFIICGTGIGLAVIFFIMELFISRVQRFPKKVTRSKKVKRVKHEGNGPIDQHATGLKVYRARLKGAQWPPNGPIPTPYSMSRPLEVSQSTYEPPNENLTKVFRDATAGFPSSMVYRGSTSEV